MIQIIPAIDIIGGACVRLSQGDFGRQETYDVSPVEMACRFAAAGLSRIHLVDLEGAKDGRPRNLKVLSEIRSAVPMEIEWGGGINKEDHVEMALECGADHVVIGSTAVKEPLKFIKWLRKHGGFRIILGADVRDGLVAVHGWQESSSLKIADLLDRMVPEGLEEVIVTDISRDGMLEGPSVPLYTSLMKEYPGLTFTVSGGISSMDDIKSLDMLGLPRVIVGKALYRNLITLEEISTWLQRG